jgi:hypothetical protein
MDHFYRSWLVSVRVRKSKEATSTTKGCFRNVVTDICLAYDVGTYCRFAGTALLGDVSLCIALPLFMFRTCNVMLEPQDWL